MLPLSPWVGEAPVCGWCACGVGPLKASTDFDDFKCPLNHWELLLSSGESPEKCGEGIEQNTQMISVTESLKLSSKFELLRMLKAIKIAMCLGNIGILRLIWMVNELFTFLLTSNAVRNHCIM